MTSSMSSKKHNLRPENELSEWTDMVGVPNVFLDVDAIDWEDKLFLGSAGSGKSYRAAQMLMSRYYKRGSAVWVNIPRMLFDLRRNFENEIVNRILRKEYVVLDDLGAEHTTDWVTETVYIIVNNIWENQKHLIVTSNLDVSGIGERFGDRLSSRILDICEPEGMKDRDRRLNKD